MITTLLASHTFASLPNSRLKTPIVPGPQTSCVIKRSTPTHTLSPGATRALLLARARTFSVRVIGRGRWRRSGPGANGMSAEAVQPGSLTLLGSVDVEMNVQNER